MAAWASSADMRRGIVLALLALGTGSNAAEPTPACRGPGPHEGACDARNVDGGALEPCRSRHDTGFFRDGYCRTDAQDAGAHVVCAEVTQAFLDFTRGRGNDLVTPSRAFPGLRAGDAWCLCAGRWREAIDAGIRLPARTEATEASALRVATREELSSGRARSKR
jgi:hypothetical protein